MPSYPNGSPSHRRQSPKPHSPQLALRQEAYLLSSASPPPTSPNRHTHRIRAGYGNPSQPPSATEEKYSADESRLRDEMRNQDDADPHDLTYPTKHFPRASMVDNLVMSLDQFSPAPESQRNTASHSASARLTKGRNTSAPFGGDITTKTLSVFDEDQLEEDPRASGAEQIPNIFGEEEETQRDRVYNAQRALQSTRAGMSRPNPKPKRRSGSNSSNSDLSHLASYVGRLGPAGNRRSQSFDFGSSRPVLMDDSNDPTPAPNSLTSSNGVTGPSLARRNSGKSSKSAHTRKTRSGTNTTTHGKSRVESPQPPLPFKAQTFEQVGGKTAVATPVDQTATPRAGFFRRVFGSSNKATTGVPPSASASASPARPSQERSGSQADTRRPVTPPAKLQKQPPPEPSSNKENQQVITKKPSSFFRRRKKSTSGGVPPPLPLTLNNNLDTSQVGMGEPSPVSSLRAFMDPYLANNANHAAKHTRGSSLQSVQHVDDVSRTTKSQSATTKHAGSHTKTPSVERGSKTVVPFASESSHHVRSPTNDSDTNFSRRRDSQATLDANRSPQSRTSNTQVPKPMNSELPPGVAVSASVASPTNLSISSIGPSNALHTESVDARGDRSSDILLDNAPKFDSYPSIRNITRRPKSSGSDASEYKSAPSTPLVADIPEPPAAKPLAVHVSHPSLSQKPTNDDIEKARTVHDNVDEEVNYSNACAWLGESSAERENVRRAYMNLFDWTSHTILAALRNLCSKLVLKGETQQVDRILDAFAVRWCECNGNHGFKSTDIVHTICYSVLLLNTDLHLADIGRKMTRAEFVRNAMDTIRHNVPGLDARRTDSPNFLTVRTNSNTGPGSPLRPSMDRSTSSLSNSRPTEMLSREESYDDNQTNLSGPLVDAPFNGAQAGWELQIESVLKDFYLSISKEPLPLFGTLPGTRVTPQQSNNNLSTMSNLRRTPSTLSKATSETRGRYPAESRSLGARWASKTRSRPRIGSAQAFGSSRTSVDDQSSAWSPSMSSTWSKASLGKTLTSMSVESFGTDYNGGGYQSSIGFANALSQAIIRDEQMEGHTDDGIKAVPLLEDESLELYGAPWAKEGILKHKCHLEGVDKRSKDRNWNDCFAVIEKGWMRLFSFSMTAKSLRNKAKNQKAGAVVGGGNWQDNAEEVWKFMLRHTIASSLPPPGYSKQRPYVWALSLPNGAVHLFSVGTPDIVKEFVSTANFWSARLSKEPMTGGISSMEYGWSDNVVNRVLTSSDTHPTFNTSSPRPSTQLSMRSSLDHGGMRPRLPGDKAHITEWTPPQQSLMASQLLEIDQVRALQTYVKNVEDELQKHNELRGPMLLAFSTRHPNSQKAMTNWEKKSSYLLHEIVKFRTYIDTLQTAQISKERVDKMREEAKAS